MITVIHAPVSTSMNFRHPDVFLLFHCRRRAFLIISTDGTLTKRPASSL
jgi:hypothetical protein